MKLQATDEADDVDDAAQEVADGLRSLFMMMTTMIDVDVNELTRRVPQMI